MESNSAKQFIEDLKEWQGAKPKEADYMSDSLDDEPGFREKMKWRYSWESIEAIPKTESRLLITGAELVAWAMQEKLEQAAQQIQDFIADGYPRLDKANPAKHAAVRLLSLLDNGESRTIPKGHGDTGGTTPKSKPPKWTFENAELEVKSYLAKNQKEFSDAMSAIDSRKKGAQEGADKLFGRNAISKATGISTGLVSKLPAYRTIANAVGQRAASTNGIKKKDFRPDAHEKGRTAPPASDEAEVNEAVATAHRKLPPAQAAAIEDQLRLGDITVECAYVLIDLAAEQAADEKAKTVPSTRA
jgi:hypothetical protein